jgi:hypothetical protein
MATTMGARDVEAAALGTIGAARINQGDPGGLTDLERCVALCEEVGSSTVISWHNNLAYARSILGNLRGSFAATQAAWHAAERYGGVYDLRWIERTRVAEHYWTGRWDQVLQVAETVVAEAAGGAREYLECECRVWRGRMLLARGEVIAALQDATRALELARESGDVQNLDPALGFAARALLTVGRTAEAGQAARGVAYQHGQSECSTRTWALTWRSTLLSSDTRPTSWMPYHHLPGGRRHARLSPAIPPARPASMPRSAPGPMRPTRDSKRPAGSSPTGTPPRPLPSW